MNNSIAITQPENITNEQSEALALHQRILVNANMAVACWTETCKDLKRMRDAKLYTALGFKSFSAYTEQALGIKERQAYTYIQTLEKLGGEFLKQNADIGITKLSLLTSVPVMERQELVDNNDIAGMSVAEVKKLVAENDGRGEQISLLNEKIEGLIEESDEKQKDIDYAEQRIAELEKELEQERNKPTVTEVREIEVSKITDEEIAQIKAKAEDDVRKEFEAEKKELKKQASEEKKKAVEKYKQQLADLVTEKREILERAAELEKRLAVTSSPETVKFTFYFDSLQNDYSKLFESLSKIKTENPEVAAKYSDALSKYMQMMSAKL